MLGVTHVAYYGDMTYDVTNAVITNITLDTYTGSEPKLDDRLHLVLHITVKNELKSRAQLIDLNFFHLVEDDIWKDATKMPGTPALNVQPGSSISFKIAFDIPDDFKFADGVFVIAEPGTETAPLSLSESSTESGYPVSLEIASGQKQVTSANPCGTTMLVETLGAVADLDARIDLTGLAGAIDGTRRAAEGERFIRIDMRATGDSGECGGANVQDAIFRLQVEGVPFGAVNHVNDTAQAGTAVEFTLLYRVPVDAEELVLLAGAPAGTVAEYPLTFEKLSP